MTLLHMISSLRSSNQKSWLRLCTGLVACLRKVLCFDEIAELRPNHDDLRLYITCLKYSTIILNIIYGL